MARSLSHRVTSRTIDVLGASLLLLAAAPVLLVAVLLIKLDEPRAPVLFRQKRAGRHGRSFTIYKLRTMRVGASAEKAALRARSEVAWPDFRLNDDPRVTRHGRWMRRTSVDELPQLFNVVRGDMALVGPRPTSFAPTTYDPWQGERLEQRPGLTGPWQVEGRGRLDFEERCRLEVAFFRSPSLRRELWLLARTPLEVLRRTGVA